MNKIDYLYICTQNDLKKGTTPNLKNTKQMSGFIAISKMKRILLSAMLLLSATAAWAQDELIPFHYTGYDLINPQGILSLRNGDFVTKTTVASPNADTIYGNVFHKVSRTQLAVTDSLFVADGIGAFHLLARNPIGDDNLRIFITNEDDNIAYLHIEHFTDDDLIGNPANNVVVPLCHDFVDDCLENMIDSRNDLILTYYTTDSTGASQGHLTRFGLDGTLKHEESFPGYLNQAFGFGEFSESPLMYYKWKKNEDDNLVLYLLDEDFHVAYSYIFLHEYNPLVEHFQLNPGSLACDDHVFPDGDHIVVATTYKRDSLLPVYDSLGNWYGYGMGIPDSVKYGAAMARYEVGTGRLDKLVHLNEMLGTDFNAGPNCLGVHRLPDGGFLYAFEEGALFMAVRLDSDLDIIWKRYCNLSNISQGGSYFSAGSTLFDNGEDERGMAVFGYSISPKTYDVGFFNLFIYDKGTENVTEKESLIRPYAFWPNPAQGELRLQYSPDVQPKRIELYAKAKAWEASTCKASRLGSM